MILLYVVLTLALQIHPFEEVMKRGKALGSSQTFAISNSYLRSSEKNLENYHLCKYYSIWYLHCILEMSPNR